VKMTFTYTSAIFVKPQSDPHQANLLQFIA